MNPSENEAAGQPPLGWLALLALALAACTPGTGELSTPMPATEPAPATFEAATAEPTAALTASPPPRTPYRLQPGELLLAAPEDSIPAIFASDDLFVDAQAGSAEWDPDDPVIGLIVGDRARAYPVRLLSLHEIVNDVIAGAPVAVTWCPLCYSALVFDRRVAGRERTFGVSGYLLKSNLVMYDHQTNTLWSQLLAQAIRGADSGEFLQVLPSQLTTWSAWMAAHPGTDVLSAAKLGLAAADVVDPYVNYYNSGAAGLEAQAPGDDRLPAKALVAAVALGDSERAYPVPAVMEAGMIHDRLGEHPLLLIYDGAFQSVLAYSRNVEGRTLSFRSDGPDRLTDLETGSGWDPQSGEATSGELAGRRLDRLAAPLVFWFAWSELHPESELYLSQEAD